MVVKARQWFEPFEGSVVACTKEEGRTKQADSPACDINNILKRYEKTGVLPDMIKTNPSYGDFGESMEYRDALETVRFANEQFAALDAPVRARFENDPAKFLQFAADVRNIDEMDKLGLLKPEVSLARAKAAREAAVAKREAEVKPE